MRIRIGYGGPKEYRHGRYFPGGRRNNGGLTEFERLIHLIASMQILFGSRRGGALLPLLIIAVLVGGFFLYRMNYSPERALEKAHAMWDSNDTNTRIKAKDEYKRLLNKSDPIEPGRRWLTDDRDKLYQRIIKFEVKYAMDDDTAAEWIQQAWDEGIRDLRFSDEKVEAFWNKTTEPWRQKNKNRSRNEIKERDRGKFDSLPGLDDDARLPRHSMSIVA